MLYKIILCVLFLCFEFGVQAQTRSFGLKGGFTAANQKVNNSNRKLLASYHAAAIGDFSGSWNTRNSTPSKLGIRTQLGYHRKGAAWSGINANGYQPKEIYHNVGLSLLLKGSYDKVQYQPYYMAGLRGEYTTKAELLTQNNAFVNSFTYGAVLGGGIEWTQKKSALSYFFEFSINPDLSTQLFIPEGTQRQYINASGQVVSTTANAEKVVNFTLEISVGILFNKTAEKAPKND